MFVLKSKKRDQTLANLILFGGLAFGDEKNLIQSPPPEKQGQAPLWSVDLNSDYTLGSKIEKMPAFNITFAVN